MFCPQCGSERIRRSRTRGFNEKIAKLFGNRAFRCREKECGWRGLLRIANPMEIRRRFLGRYKLAMIFVAVLAISLLFILLVIEGGYHPK